MIRKFSEVIIKDPLKDIFWLGKAPQLATRQIICITFLVALCAFSTNCECRNVPRYSQQLAQLRPPKTHGFLWNSAAPAQSPEGISAIAVPRQFKHNFC